MNRTRAITEGSILVALYIILLLSALYLPILGFLLMFTLSIPFIVYTYRHSVKQGILVIIVGLLLTYLTAGILVVPVTLMFGSAGVVMGYFYKKNSPAFSVLITGCLTFIINLVILYGFAVAFFQFNFVEEAELMFKESISMAERFLPGSEETNEQMQVLYDQLEMIPHIIPSGLVLFGVTFALITQLIASKVLKRLKGDIQTFPPFKQWRFPQSLLWYYLTATILTFFNFEAGSTMYIIVMNAFIVLEVVMVVQGLSFIFFFSDKRNWNKSIPIMITIMAFLLPIILYVIRILGIIDLGFNLRNRLNDDKRK